MLILHPANAVFEKHGSHIVLAIGARDECDDKVATEQLLNVPLTSKLPAHSKIVVTSRPNPNPNLTLSLTTLLFSRNGQMQTLQIPSRHGPLEYHSLK